MGKNDTGKIIIEGVVDAISPLHIGCGQGERSDMDILLDGNGNPFIPATSLIGVLRNETKLGGHSLVEKSDRFWGSADEKTSIQSSIRCNDLICISGGKKSLRDGIKIDHRTGMVKYNGKFDYEIVEAGAVFKLHMEITLTEENESFALQMTSTICNILNNGDISVGAKTNSGLGEIRLRKDELQLYRFDFKDKNHVFNWLTQQFTQKNKVSLKSLGESFVVERNFLRIDLTLSLNNSLLIRTYPNNPEAPDAVHIHNKNGWVLPASSMKGAIRARAGRISKTLGKKAEFTDNLFGFVDESGQTERAVKGRVRIKEIILPKYVSEIQNRIKIDRFTGGTIEGALFDTMPLFDDKQNKNFNLIIEINRCSEEQAGLMLLVVKDLWTGDIAVGGEKNVGRGVLKGEKAFIHWNDEHFYFDQKLDGLDSKAKFRLQQFVDALMG